MDNLKHCSRRLCFHSPCSPQKQCSLEQSEHRAVADWSLGLSRPEHRQGCCWECVVVWGFKLVSSWQKQPSRSSVQTYGRVAVSALELWSTEWLPGCKSPCARLALSWPTVLCISKWAVSTSHPRQKACEKCPLGAPNFWSDQNAVNMKVATMLAYCLWDSILPNVPPEWVYQSLVLVPYQLWDLTRFGLAVLLTP